MFVFVPRYFEPQARRKGTVAQLVLLRWAFAIAPALVGIALLGAGADRWVAPFTLAMSIILLFAAAKATSTTQ
jgi:hypothetical protein